MQIATDTPREAYTIAGNEYQIAQPFAEGDTINEGEADGLNQLLAENVRNNLSKKGKDGTLTQAEVDAYVAQYEFGVRQGGGGRTADPVMREALAIADRPVRDALAKAGHKLTGKDADISTKDFNALKRSYVEKHHDAVWPMAEARVAAIGELPVAEAA